MPNIVQSNYEYFTSASSFSVAMPNSTKTGHTLVAFFICRTGVPTGATIADTQGNSWTPIFSPQDGGNADLGCAAWYAPCGRGADTITVTFTSANAGLVVVEFDQLGALDSVTTSVTGSGSTLTTNSLTPTANELALGFFTSVNDQLAVSSPAVTAGSLGGWGGMGAYTVPGGSYAMSVTTGSQASLGILATFKFAPATYGYAQSSPTTQTNYGGSSTPQTSFTTQTTQAGNLLVAFVEIYPATTTVTSVTDSQGNSWTLEPQLSDDNTYVSYVAYALNTAGGSKDTVTFHCSGTATNAFISLAEYAGANAFRGISTTGSASGTSSGTVTATSGSVTAQANDILVGVGSGYPSATDAVVSFSAGFTARTNTTNTSNAPTGIADSYPASAGSVSVSASLAWASGTLHVYSTLLDFYLAGGGGLLLMGCGS